MELDSSLKPPPKQALVGEATAPRLSLAIVMSPKSVAFPSEAIVTYLIVFITEPPPAASPLVEFDAPIMSFCVTKSSPKSEPFPVEVTSK